MAKPLLDLNVSLDPGTGKMLSRYAAQLMPRARMFMSGTTQRVAEKVYADLVMNMPNDAPELKKSVRVDRVRGGPAAFAVWLKPQTQRVKREDKDRILLTVSSKRGAFRVPKTVKVLEDFSPWTLDTIPLAPDTRFAIVTQRRVSEWAVDQVRKDRKRDKRKWFRMLAGKVPTAQLRKREEIDAVSDLLLQTMMYEFGLGGKYQPHWRPAVIPNIRPQAVASIMNTDKTLKRILADPEYRRWRAWPKLPNQISMDVVNTFTQFQKKLGILS